MSLLLQLLMPKANYIRHFLSIDHKEKSMRKITPEQKFKNARAQKVLSAPVIDMERLLFDSKENEKLYEALVNAGFLYLSNHGIDKNLIQEIKRVSGTRSTIILLKIILCYKKINYLTQNHMIPNSRILSSSRIKKKRARGFQRESHS